MKKQQHTYPIRCPQCGNQQDALLTDVVDAEDAPELKDDLIRNQLNCVRCERCDLIFRVDKRVLYHDPNRKYMVYLVPVPFKDLHVAEEEFMDMQEGLLALIPDELDAPQATLVIDRTELVERIFLQEAGIPPNVAEYAKYMLYTKSPEMIDPRKKILLYNREDSTDEKKYFVVQDAETKKLEKTVELPGDALAAILEVFENDEMTGMVMEMFPGPYISARALLMKEFNDRSK